MKSIDYSLKDFQYEGTRTFFFRIEDAFMPGKFLDMYDTWLPIGVDLTCAEFHELFEVYCNYYDSGECKTADDLCGEEAIYYKLPHIKDKVMEALEAQAPKYYGEDIIPVVDQFNVYFPHEFQDAHMDLKEGIEPLVLKTFDIQENGEFLSECSVFSEGKLNIPDGVKKFRLAAVNNCTRITEVYMPDSVVEMDSMTFEDCYSLRSIRLSENLKSIPMATFETCVFLKELTIPETVEEIEKYAFNYCLSLEKLTIKSKRCTFAQGVFTGCNALKEIHFALTEIDNVGYIFPDSIVNNATLYVPATKLDDYKKHRHFGLFKTIIPE